MNSIYNFIDYRGKTPIKREKGIPLVTAKNVKKGYISYIPADYISPEEFQERKSRGVSRKGDILFTTEAPLGNAALADLEMFSAGQRIITFQQYTSNNLFPNKLQLFFILSPYFQELLDNQHTGSTVAGIKAERLKKLLLPFPPAKEQVRIMTCIDDIMSIVGIIDQEAEFFDNTLALAKHKILDLAIRGKLVPQDPNDEPASELLKKIKAEKETLIKAGKMKRDKHESFIFKGDDNCYHEQIDAKNVDISEEIPFELPQGWEWCRLSEIGSVLYGVSESARVQGKYKLLRITDIQNDCVNWDMVPYTDYPGDATPYILQENDIVFARTGASVGKSYLIKTLPSNAIYASYLIRVRFVLPLIAEYVKTFFGSSYYWEQISIRSVGTGQPNVNGSSLAGLLLPLPPLAEQKRIVSQIEKMLSVLETMHE